MNKHCSVWHKPKKIVALKRASILKNVIEDTFSVTMNRGEISHLLKRLMFRYTTDLHTETNWQEKQEVFQPQRYNKYYLSMWMKVIFSKSEYSRTNFGVIKKECNCQPSAYASYRNTKVGLFIFGVYKWVSRKCASPNWFHVYVEELN